MKQKKSQKDKEQSKHENKQKNNAFNITYKKVNSYLVKTDDKFEPLLKDILKVTKQNKVVDKDLNFINSRMKKALEEMDHVKTEVSKIEDEKAKDTPKDKSKS